nr:hypothetical protein [Tanacetum cinerariifolium]
IIMVNLPPPNNDPNVPKGDQAPAAPDGFAPYIASGEIHPRVATVEEQVQVMKSQAMQVIKSAGADPTDRTAWSRVAEPGVADHGG